MPPESLFDGRYRYDHIYPRGRSGEALRAYDTLHDDLPVVIKRPAPQDAPPIRAGQEINIRTERRALLQLKGHPVLTNLLDEGTFRVGGQVHLYIVIERATGVMLEEEVLALAKSNARLPELEMLVIIDRLLGLLAEAHKHEIVYNDVDAKHLFWDRDTYELKLIDWGNAVFLEGDTITPAGISRQSDVYQAGELLYFVLTGGQRLVVNGGVVDFGEHAEHISTRLQHIVQRAVQPSPEQRYPDIGSLRHDLTQYRLPIERDRNGKLDRIARRLNRQASQGELERFLQEVEAVRINDPGFPQARELSERISSELHRLAVLADLDAIRIYMDSANWPRAITLLEDVVEHARGGERTRAQLLLEAASLVDRYNLSPPPEAIPHAIDAIFDDQLEEAVRLLLMTPEERGLARDVQWLYAVQIQRLIPEIVVLRPHLLRLDMDLAELDRQRVDVADARRILGDAKTVLDDASVGHLQRVIHQYQQLVDQMSALADRLSSASTDQAELRNSALTAAQHAAAAARAIVVQLQAAGAQATANVPAAQDALAAARALDPPNSVFDSLQATLRALQDVLETIAEFRPYADGSDLVPWFDDVIHRLQPFTERLPDPRLGMLTGTLQDGRLHWVGFQQAVVTGNQRAALDHLQQAADAVRRLNAPLAAWFNNVHGVVARGRYIQRHALNAAFGRAMADGWTAWDRGSGIEAERLGKQALEQVDNEAEAMAADRLIRLGKLLRGWKENNGEGDPALTARIDDSLLALLTTDEDRYWQQFTEQMPSPQAYLDSMSSGLVEYFEQTSTAAQRILFFHFVLRGVLDMYEDSPEDAEFWRAAASKSLLNADQHIAFLTLENVIRDRRSVAALVERIEAIETVEDVAAVRQQIERSALHLLLKPLVTSFRAVEDAVPAWRDGDFRKAAGSLEVGLNALADGERLAHVHLDRYRAWLERLNQMAAELSVVRQRIVEAAASAPEEELDSRMEAWHRRLIADTAAFLGEKNTKTFVSWQDVYRQVTAIYTDDSKRRSRKLHDLDEVLNATRRLDDHPAVALYRAWYAQIDAQPEFPAPPTDEPVPQYAEEVLPRAPLTTIEGELGPRRRSSRRFYLLGAVGLVVLIGLGAAAVLLGGGGPGEVAVTWETPSPTVATEEPTATIEAVVMVVTDTPAPTLTATPTHEPSATLTETRLPSSTPTATDLPSLEPAESFLPTAEPATPTALPPTATRVAVAASPTPVSQQVTEPVRGQQHVLLVLEQAAQIFPWPESWFRPGDLGGGWVLGVSETSPDDNLLQVVLPADLLSQFFGPDAGVRLRRIEVTLTLREYDPALVEDGLVYFGLGLQGADESRVAAQAQLVRADAINVGARVGNEFRARTTVPINNASVKVALERYDDGTVGLFMDDTSLGAPRFLTAPNAPVVPFLFVQEGGVVVTVTDLIAQFD